MVNPKVNKKQQATNEFVRYLSEDTSHLAPHYWKREIADALKDMAVKYEEFSSPSAECSQEWHEYFVKGLTKFLRELPSSTTDLKIAVFALGCEEDAARIRALGINTQIQSGSPASTNKTPKAPAPHVHQNSNQNANRKRQAENQAENKVTATTETEAEAQERPAKRVKRDLEEVENATTSSGCTVETEGPMSLAIRISDNDRTSTFDLNGHGPAIVTVNVKKTGITASASANGNKEAEKEGAA